MCVAIHIFSALSFWKLINTSYSCCWRFFFSDLHHSPPYCSHGFKATNYFTHILDILWLAALKEIGCIVIGLRPKEYNFGAWSSSGWFKESWSENIKSAFQSKAFQGLIIEPKASFQLCPLSLSLLQLVRKVEETWRKSLFPGLCAKHLIHISIDSSWQPKKQVLLSALDRWDNGVLRRLNSYPDHTIPAKHKNEFETHISLASEPVSPINSDYFGKAPNSTCLSYMGL